MGEDEGKPNAAADRAVPAPAPRRARKPVSVAPITAAQPPAARRGAIAPPPKAALAKASALKPAASPAAIAPPPAKPAPAKAIPQSPPAAPKPLANASRHGPQPKKVKAAITTAPVPMKTPSSSKPHFMQKDFIMDMTSSYKNGFQDAFVDVKDKAKEAFEKGSSMLGEVGEFTRGNVEAMVESSKILASGLQDMGTSFATESRSAFEVMTADLKDLAAAKTPADFLKIQSEIIRKSFDGAVAYGSKNSEAVLKLATETFAPITGRVSLAVEKARTSI